VGERIGAARRPAQKCSFCDIHLPYVGDYDTATAQNLVDKVEECIAQTGHTGFHFVDEAMPPKVMRDFAIEVLRRDLHISWHGMLRFDKAYTPEMCKLLAASGLIAVFGGLEVASDRLLSLMKKGTTVEQVAQVAKNFRDAGIRVHGYIMYGFPTQTAQETIDALDVVRQLFKQGLLTSASWAKFGVTPHSPIGRNPEEYNITLLPMPQETFVEQIIPHLDPTGADHDKYTKGLQEALRYYGLGFHFDAPSEGWFDFPVPPVSIDRNWIAQVISQPARAKEPSAAAGKGKAGEPAQRDRRVLWLGTRPTIRMLPWQEGQTPQAELTLYEASGDHRLSMPAVWAQWLLGVLDQARIQPGTAGNTSLKELEDSWEACVRAPAKAAAAAAAAAEPPGPAAPSFDEFLQSPVWQALQDHGLILTQQRQRVIWTGAAPAVQTTAAPPVPTAALTTTTTTTTATAPATAAVPLAPDHAELVLSHDGSEAGEDRVALRMPKSWATWLADVLRRSQPDAPQVVDLAELRRSFPGDLAAPRPAPAATPAEHMPFREFIHTPVWQALLQRGLALV
jgi:hypothetical protein